jgi:hypothetical protein
MPSCRRASTPVRRLRAQISLESAGSGSRGLLKRCTPPPIEKRRRLRLRQRLAAHNSDPACKDEKQVDNQSVDLAAKVPAAVGSDSACEPSGKAKNATALPVVPLDTSRHHTGCATPPPPEKRRRLRLTLRSSGAARGLTQDVGDEVMGLVAQTSAAAMLSGRNEVEPMAEMPAAAMLSGGIEEKVRLVLCARVREEVRRACCRAGGTADRDAAHRREVCIRVQVLACYFLQAVVSSSRLAVHGHPQDQSLVAAAAKVALEACGVACGVACGAAVAQKDGTCTASHEHAPQTEEAGAEGRAEAAILYAVAQRGGVPEQLSLDALDSAMRCLVSELPGSDAFCRWFCCNLSPQAAALELAPRLLHVSRCFAADAAMSSTVALDLEPELVAAAAMALAARHELRGPRAEVTLEELAGLLAEKAGGKERLGLALRELLQVFYLWSEMQSACTQ